MFALVVITTFPELSAQTPGPRRFVVEWNRATICTAVGVGAVLLSLIVVLVTSPLRRDARFRSDQPLGMDGQAAPMKRMTPPDGLGPGEVSMLLRGGPGLDDVAAMLMDLARRGALTISLPAEPVEVADVDTATPSPGPNWRLTRAAFAVPLTPAEHVLLDGLFEQSPSVSIRHITSNLPKLTSRVSDQMRRDITGRGWFKTSLVTAGKAHVLLLVAVIVGAASWLASPVAAGWRGQWFTATGGIVVALLLAIALFWRPGRTRQGTAVYEQAKAYESYLTLVAENRASGLHDPEVAAAWALAFGMADTFVQMAQPRSMEEAYAYRYPWWLFATAGAARLRVAANPSVAARSASDSPAGRLSGRGASTEGARR